MKMIASTKLARAQKAMEAGRVYGKSTNSVYSFLKPQQPLKEKEEGVETGPVLMIACSSDRGLCGAIHSSISKLVRKEVRENPSSTKVLVLGDKAKPQIARDARKNIVMHFNQVGRNIPTFLDACNIVDVMTKQNMDFSVAKIAYNSFKSVIAYENTILSAYPEKKLAGAGK